MSKYQAYPEYKDSGVEWIGLIPTSWMLAKTSRFFKIAMGQTILKENLIDNGKWPVFSATEGEHYFGRVNDPIVQLEKGDLVIPARGNSIGAVKLVKEQSTTTQTTIYCKRLAHSALVSNYIYYFFLSHRHDLFRFTQTAIPQITTEEVGTNPILIPSQNEAHKIAAFLDHETAKIDTLIEKQQQLIELLKEKRQAVISHAVTKGLNPQAPMKDSGVEWLGEVPEHWVVTPYKHLTNQITVGIVVTPAKYYVDTGIKCLRSLNVGQNEIKDNNWVYISNESNKTLKKTQVYTGDIVVVRSGQTGAAAEITEQYNGINCIDLIIIRKTKKLCSTFACFQLNSDFIRHQVSLGSEGAIQQHFNVEVANSLLMSLPPMKEQLAITSFLIKKENQFSTLLHAAEKQILLLQERRTALISAAVTGKIDVRHFTLEDGVAPTTSSDTNEAQHE